MCEKHAYERASLGKTVADTGAWFPSRHNLEAVWCFERRYRADDVIKVSQHNALERVHASFGVYPQWMIRRRSSVLRHFAAYPWRCREAEQIRHHMSLLAIDSETDRPELANLCRAKQ
jgi:2-polyprenyl-6-methoxyphenol hydroxylase-like FAD-dependent oxidoreductase